MMNALSDSRNCITSSTPVNSYLEVKRMADALQAARVQALRAIYSIFLSCLTLTLTLTLSLTLILTLTLTLALTRTLATTLTLIQVFSNNAPPPLAIIVAAGPHAERERGSQCPVGCVMLMAARRGAPCTNGSVQRGQ